MPIKIDIQVLVYSFPVCRISQNYYIHLRVVVLEGVFDLADEAALVLGLGEEEEERRVCSELCAFSL